MADEPDVKRTAVFVDGQNLFHAAKSAFGYAFPNYDVLALAAALCELQRWRLVQTSFYTGVPTPTRSEEWNAFWERKLQV